MKQIVTGGIFFLGGCILFAACMICTAFDGVVPSDVQSEQFLAILLMIVGAAILIHETWIMPFRGNASKKNIS